MTFDSPRTLATTTTAPARRRTRLYLALLVSFPFLVLFSPRIDIGVTHARVDELLIIAWLPIAVDFSRAGRLRRPRSAYVGAFFALFMVFAFGIVYGDGTARWSQSNLKLVIRPAVVAANLLVIRYWLHRSRASVRTLAMTLVVSVAIAGMIGYVAMTNPGLASLLRSVYSSGIDLYDDDYSFDMSRRAMSVFSGYDQAGVTYAMGIIVALYLLLNAPSARSRVVSGCLIAALLLSIVTSARIGFVSALFGGLVLLALRRSRLPYLAAAVGFAAVFIFVLLPFGHYVLPNSGTLERFEDVQRLFDFSSSTPFWERSEGVSGVLETQVYGIRYPEGADAVFGFGDQGAFVSDSGFITVYVKYGLVGIAAVLYVLLRIGRTGDHLDRQAQRIFSGAALSLSGVLPGLATLFVVGSLKGGLYFVTYKIGELFAFVLALSITESELLLSRDARDARALVAEPVRYRLS